MVTVLCGPGLPPKLYTLLLKATFWPVCGAGRGPPVRYRALGPGAAVLHGPGVPPGTHVGVADGVPVGVAVGVRVDVGVAEAVAVAVGVAVGVRVAVGLAVAVAVGVGVGPTQICKRSVIAVTALPV